MYGSLDDINRTREAMRRRIAWLNKKNCKTAKEIDEILKEQVKLGKEIARADVIKALFKCFTDLIRRTPVDTGRLRAGWQVSGNSADIEWKPPPGIYPEYQNNDIAGILERKFNSANLSEADTIYVFNNVEYLLALNAGWSKNQAGNFIDLFLQELKAALEKAASAA